MKNCYAEDVFKQDVLENKKCLLGINCEKILEIPNIREQWAQFPSLTLNKSSGVDAFLQVSQNFSERPVK